MVTLPDCIHCKHWRACTLQQLMLRQIREGIEGIKIPDGKKGKLTLSDLGFEVEITCRNEE